MDIRIEGVSKRFEATTALHPTDLAIPSGQLVALLGPSGSGKTTLLRLIAGLLPVDGGRVLFGDRDATRLSLRERRVGFVFQHYALFPHLSVFENVAFGLRCRPRATRPDAATITRRVGDLLALVQMSELRDRLPDQLSGGQKQRVALARAMAIEPTVLLLDEPFGALDARVRVELRRWLRRIHDETGFTTVFVTHDQEEALELADRVVVMNGGRIEQDGAPDQVYAEPATPFVFDFLGRSNQIRGQVQDGEFLAGEGRAPLSVLAPATGAATLFARPHDIDVVGADQGLAATVTEVRTLAGRLILEASLAGQARPVEVDLPATSGATARPGDQIGLNLRRYRVFSDGVT
ncbi:sulfate/molybdate ABC transporter ATP-binding protein [Arenimonas sp. MALMAid1274]|uniref:sulfate/molybdate ABC transporter ATP-binding protein n=1 Tax=Arenimonas sp. MALMAid1274 TaxID=3411630 RepID=UPI003B9EC58A